MYFTLYTICTDSSQDPTYDQRINVALLLTSRGSNENSQKVAVLDHFEKGLSMALSITRLLFYVLRFEPETI